MIFYKLPDMNEFLKIIPSFSYVLVDFYVHPPNELVSSIFLFILV